MRIFSVVKVVSRTGRIKGSENLTGIFKSSTPVSAAKKAFSRICNQSKIKGVCSFTVTVKEVTRDSHGKEFTYKINRLKNPTTVEHGGTMIVHKFVIKAKSLNRK